MVDKLTVRAYWYPEQSGYVCTICETQVDAIHGKEFLSMSLIRDGDQYDVCSFCVPVLRRIAQSRLDRLSKQIEEYNLSMNKRIEEWCEAIDVIDRKEWAIKDGKG